MSLDFRSDTVTRPSEAMRNAMYRAEAGLFATSGTQANLVALMAHCQRGDEYIVGQQAHTYKYEGGGAAVLGSIQPQPIEFSEDGSIDLEAARAAIKPDDPHFANTKLFCLENTHAGKALSMDYLKEAEQFVQSENLAYHLDGARVYNAAIFHGVDVAEITAPFDSSTCCFSKGLGAPMGSVTVGTREFIQEAHRWRKLLGGGLRQAGVVAAAALYAVDNNVERLAEDHENAKWIADHLSQVEELDVRYHKLQTNMVFVSMPEHDPRALAAYLRERDIVITPGATTRIVTHLDVDREAAKLLVNGIKDYFVSIGSGLSAANRIRDYTEDLEHHGGTYQGSAA